MDIELAPLTILTGVNSVGKSTVLQALAVLNQTILGNQLNQHLCLTGFNIDLGCVSDIANQAYGRRGFAIGLHNESLEIEWQTSAAADERSLDAFINVVGLVDGSSAEVQTRTGTDGDQMKLLRLVPEEWNTRANVRRFCSEMEVIKYISSDRLAPQDTYPVLPNSQLRTVGPRGQYCASFIDSFGADDALLPSAEGSQATVKKLVTEYVDSFFPGYVLEPRRIDQTSLMSLLIFDPSNALHRIQNVGFGISHSVPIITQCVGSQAGDTLLIETPESYLHPAAQSKMGRFLASTAARGIQVIVETHSDHIINGIRRAVASRIISADDVCIHFVSKDPDEEQPRFKRINVTPEGRLDSWPPGFFDQIENDLMSLP